VISVSPPCACAGALPCRRRPRCFARPLARQKVARYRDFSSRQGSRRGLVRVPWSWSFTPRLREMRGLDLTCVAPPSMGCSTAWLAAHTGPLNYLCSARPANPRHRVHGRRRDSLRVVIRKGGLVGQTVAGHRLALGAHPATKPSSSRVFRRSAEQPTRNAKRDIELGCAVTRPARPRTARIRLLHHR